MNAFLKVVTYISVIIGGNGDAGRYPRPFTVATSRARDTNRGAIGRRVARCRFESFARYGRKAS